MTDQSKALLNQIKLALKAEKDSAKLMADTIKATEKDKATDAKEKSVKKATYEALIAENKAATTVTKLNAVIDKLVKELMK